LLINQYKNVENWSTAGEHIDKKLVSAMFFQLTPMSELQVITCHKGSYSVTRQPTQVSSPNLNPSKAGWCSIYSPWKDEGCAAGLASLTHRRFKPGWAKPVKPTLTQIKLVKTGQNSFLDCRKH